MRMLEIAAVLAVATSAFADGVQMTERPHHITEARIVIDASPAEVYDVVTAYQNWRTILSDIRAVTVEGGDRDHARVRFKSHAIGRTVTVQFDNVPGRSITFRGVKGPPGGRAAGSYALTPIDGGKRTHVVAQLYMDVVGAPGLFVRDSEIREVRRAKLHADLRDIATHFGRSSGHR